MSVGLVFEVCSAPLALVGLPSAAFWPVEHFEWEEEPTGEQDTFLLAV